MWLVACSFLLLALRTQGHQHWRKEPILLRTYPVEDTAEPTLVKEPPILKRGEKFGEIAKNHAAIGT